MTTHPNKVALVTGANRGIGLETGRQLAKLGFTVLLGVRDVAKGEAAAKGLDGHAEAIALDVAAPDAAARAADEVERRFGRLDVLINNAAIHYDTGSRALRPDWTVIREAFETNVFGAWRVAAAFAPQLRAGGHGRLVNVSSEGGSLGSMGAGAGLFDIEGDTQCADLRAGGGTARLRRAGQCHLPRLGRHRHGRAGRTPGGARGRRHRLGRDLAG